MAGIPIISIHFSKKLFRKDGLRISPQDMAKFKSYILNSVRFNDIKNILKELFKKTTKTV